MKMFKWLLSLEKVRYLPKNILSRNYHCVQCKRINKYFFVTAVNRPLISFNSLSNSSTCPEESSNLVENDSSELIIFNSFKGVKNRRERNRSVNRKLLNDLKPSSISLKYLNDFENKSEYIDESVDSCAEVPTESFNFPYSQKFSVDDKIFELDEQLSSSTVANNEIEYEDKDGSIDQSLTKLSSSKYGKRWMNDYEKYTEESEDETGIDEWRFNYGTANPDKPVSNVPCGGCGAFLHCQDPAIPGYLPSEIFSKCNNKDLISITCQRCHFMKYYNTALAVSVDKELYPKLLSKIKNEKALVILMVDLTDFPCSIWPGILDIIGKKRPIFVVGNKVDLLWGDSKHWLTHVTNLLASAFPSDANIKHVALISAKTGFGIEELINKLHNIWKYNGDVYLLGCTNVGKSTLFNAFLQSDYCRVKAVDLLQRATTSPWPGTTINLLKFPILRPVGWRLRLRTMRLIDDRKKIASENKLRKELLKATKTKETVVPQIIGHIGRTFTKVHTDNNEEGNNFNIPSHKHIMQTSTDGSGLDPKDPDFAKSKWFYDTPGVLHSDQILDLLTTEELMLTIPKEIIEPRTFLMKPNWTIFIAGLARLDYIEGNCSVRMTVFSSNTLPITICYTNDADQIYKDCLGTKYMAVPQGSQERLKQWPNLKAGNAIPLMGANTSTSCADIILSSAGWISIQSPVKEICKFVPWTPEKRGIHVRIPPLLPNAVNLRGNLIRKTPVYAKSKPFQ
ncbi:hypothetical protein O3M35_010900 [Rhynocoris fuscipes]|uniref:G domain-containing protein n=1 Tax=Rhynocoris fuscipes TaxID=488301 RepID=A0AAW1D0Q4_9HEMI